MSLEGYYRGQLCTGVDELRSNGQIYYQIPKVGVVAEGEFAIADQPRFTPEAPPPAPRANPDPNGDGETVPIVKTVKSRRKVDTTLNE